MDGDPPRSGTRDNGLRCANYVGIADLDPRVADALLDTLRDEGIAAYVAPTPAQRGWSLEETRPARHTDRLWVDEVHADRARTLVEGEQDGLDDVETEPTADVDFDAAWQQVLQSLQSPSAVPSRTYTAIDVTPADVDDDDDEPDLHDPADDEHFEPPPPPPLPRLRPVTLGALAAIIIGLLILATDFDGGAFNVVAFVGIVGGVASLIWNMRNGPPTDSGWDDGAVV